MEAVPHTVELLGPVGALPAELGYGEHSSSPALPYWVRLAFGGRVLTGEGGDYFDALVALRRQLESERILIRVNGACRDVWPSGMSRNIGGGLKAYRMHLGLQARMADLVPIFEYSVGSEPTTIAEQEHFRDQWFASLAAA
jgi:hypothetical protein